MHSPAPAAELARIPGFRARLASWMRGGMGTQQQSSAGLELHLQSLGPALHAASSGARTAGSLLPAPLVRWEAPLFSSSDGRWAAAAAAIGKRWAADPAIAASAHLLARHLELPGSSGAMQRDLGGLQLVDSNQLNGLLPDVAISHSG